MKAVAIISMVWGAAALMPALWIWAAGVLRRRAEDAEDRQMRERARI